MIPTLVNNPLFRGITPEKLLADLEEISFHTVSYTHLTLPTNSRV